jgi:hypothetical protein
MTTDPDDPPTLSNQDKAYRRVLGSMFIYDENQERKRPSSAAFRRRTDEAHASVYVESLLLANDLSAEDILDEHDGLGLVVGSIALFRHHGFDVRPDPDGVNPERPHKCDSAHGAVIEPEASLSSIKKAWGRFAKEPELQVLVEPSQPR